MIMVSFLLFYLPVKNEKLKKKSKKLKDFGFFIPLLFY